MGTKKRPAARWRRDSWSNDQVARRAAAKCRSDLEYLLEEVYCGYEVFCLTVTLPGAWHGIRRASLWSQFEYCSARTTVSGYAGWHSMRGLNTKLVEWGAVGGWWFFECKYNSKQKWWNLHVHGIMIAPKGWDSSKLPVSDVDIREEEKWKRHVKSSTAGALRTLGFGERYTLDRCQDDLDVISYCTALAYCSKQQLQGPEIELVGFLRARKPRLTVPWGAARISHDDRVGWLIQNDKHDLADMLMARKATAQGI